MNKKKGVEEESYAMNYIILCAHVFWFVFL